MRLQIDRGRPTEAATRALLHTRGSHQIVTAHSNEPGFVATITGRVRAWLRLAGLAAWRGVLRLANSNDLTFASSIAYYALLSLFPFFLVAFAILGMVTADAADRARVLQFVLRYFPRQLDFVTGQLDALQQASVGLGIVGSAVIVWGSLGVFRAITSAVNHAWGVTQQRSYFKHQLVAFLMLLAAGSLMLVALFLVSAIGVIQSSWFASVLVGIPGLEVLTGFAFRYAATILLIVVVGLLFYFVPSAEVRFRDVWVGAIVTGLLWRLTLAGFSWYVRDLSRFSIHGSVAAVVVFLLWIYTSAVVLLYGVEFTAAYAKLRRAEAGGGPRAAGA